MIFSYEHTFLTKKYIPAGICQDILFLFQRNEIGLLINFTFPKAEVETSVLQHRPYPDSWLF